MKSKNFRSALRADIFSVFPLFHDLGWGVGGRGGGINLRTAFPKGALVAEKSTLFISDPGSKLAARRFFPVGGGE